MGPREADEERSESGRTIWYPAGGTTFREFDSEGASRTVTRTCGRNPAGTVTQFNPGHWSTCSYLTDDSCLTTAADVA